AGRAGAPAATADAIRAAVSRGTSATQAARTARIELAQTTAGRTTTSTGTVDLVEHRYLVEETGTAGERRRSGTYLEDGRLFVQLHGADGGWTVTDGPPRGTDPLTPVRRFAAARDLRVGGTRTYDGHRCREFTTSVPLSDLLNADRSATRGPAGPVPSDARATASACVDDRGLTYAVETAYDLRQALGDAADRLLGPASDGTNDTRTSTRLRVRDYGTAPAPRRPDGVDDAEPLGGTSTAP
ncbi:hypothetical protein ACVU7I_16110, partial [Patulibacter sp. S7RM1-6]